MTCSSCKHYSLPEDAPIGFCHHKQREGWQMKPDEKCRLAFTDEGKPRKSFRRKK